MPAPKDINDLALSPIHKHVGVIMDKDSRTLSHRIMQSVLIF